MAAAKATVVFSHWDSLYENTSLSSQEVYTALEDAVTWRAIPNMKQSRITWKEGGLLSAKREYLRVRRKEFVFDVCAAPFGKGFFFSWWLGEIPSGFLQFISLIPFIGPIVLWIVHHLIKPTTYYKLDTAYMFQKAVHATVMEVIRPYTE